MAKDVKINIVAKDKGSKVVKKFSDNTTSALKKLAGPLALVAVTVGFITKLLNDTVKLGDKFDKLNKKLGVSVETLSKMEHITNLSGVAFTIVTGSIERMQRRIGLATRGLGAAKKAFEELNIDVEELSKLNTEEQFLQLAETVMKVENPTLRAGYAFELFGMTAAELQKMLPDLRKKLSETASSMTKSQTDQFAKFADNMEKLKNSLQALSVTLFAQFVKTLNDADWDKLAEDIRNISKELSDLSAKIYYSTKAFIIALDPSKTTYERLKAIIELRKEYNKYLKDKPTGLAAIGGRPDFETSEYYTPPTTTPPTITTPTTTDLPSRDVPDLWSFGDEEHRAAFYKAVGEKQQAVEEFNKIIYESTKTSSELEIEAIKNKYAKIIEEGNLNKDEITALKKVEADEINQIYADAEQERLDKLKTHYDEVQKLSEDALEKKKEIIQTEIDLLEAMSKLSEEQARRLQVLLSLMISITAKQNEDSFKKHLELMGKFGNAFGSLADTLKTLADSSAKDSKKYFKTYKAIAKAEAVIATYTAAAKALKEYPGWAGMAMAAIITATGIAKVATINKETPKYAKGGAFTNSIVNKPTTFDTGLMGEAGPEAILPLTKTSSGELGVKSSGDQQPINNYYYSVQAMDSKSFTDYVRRNPSAITTVIGDEIQKGNSSLNSNIRRASM